MAAYVTPRRKILAFLKLTRGLFLVGGIILYNLGVVIAISSGVSIDVGKYWIGQLVVTLIQLTAQLANEYFDIEVDRINARNRTWFSGGSGILPTEVISKESIRLICIFLTFLVLFLIVAISRFSPWMACLAFVSLAGSLAYSVPPLSLMSSGFGELTTTVIVSLLVPTSGYLLQTGTLSFWMIQSILPLFFFHYGMLIAFEFPDWSADRQVGKKTICVRFGQKVTAGLHDLVIITGLFLFLFITAPHITLFGSSVFLVLLCVCQIVIVPLSIRYPSPRLYHLLTAGAIVLFTAAASMILVGSIPG